MSRVSFGPGVAIATASIGPLVALALLARALTTQPSFGDAGALLMLAPVALIVGLLVGGFVSCIPNVVGAALLGWAGTRVRMARHPLPWAVTGAMMGGGLSALVDLDLVSWQPAMAMAPAGTVSALLCRWGTDWTD